VSGVRATVGGKRIGDAALCAAYAIALVPTFSDVALASMPSLPSRAATSTPLSTKSWRVARSVGQSACITVAGVDTHVLVNRRHEGGRCAGWQRDRRAVGGLGDARSKR